MTRFVLLVITIILNVITISCSANVFAKQLQHVLVSLYFFI